MRKFLTLFGIFLVLSGCSSQPKEMKSPCVGVEGSPCGPRRSANPDLFQV